MTTKTLALLFILTSNASCLSFTNSLQTANAKDLQILIHQDREFYIANANYTETSKCLESEEQKLKIESSFKRKGKELVLHIPNYLVDSSSRAIIQVPDFFPIIPSRLLMSNLDLQYGICVNASGNVTLAQLIYSNQKLRPNEELRIMNEIFKYKLATKDDQLCLDCASFSAKYEVAKN